jgi:hypothetical protein
MRRMRNFVTSEQGQVEELELHRHWSNVGFQYGGDLWHVLRQINFGIDAGGLCQSQSCVFDPINAERACLRRCINFDHIPRAQRLLGWRQREGNTVLPYTRLCQPPAHGPLSLCPRECQWNTGA